LDHSNMDAVGPSSSLPGHDVPAALPRFSVRRCGSCVNNMAVKEAGNKETMRERGRQWCACALLSGSI
jgi:hypothetical protein